MIKSRTLLCARLTRNLVGMSDKAIKETIFKTSAYFKAERYIIDYNENLYALNKDSTKNKQNANRDVGTWISAFLKKDKK